MKGAHSVKKNNKKKKKKNKSGMALKVDPEIIQATIAPKHVRDAEWEDDTFDEEPVDEGEELLLEETIAEDIENIDAEPKEVTEEEPAEDEPEAESEAEACAAEDPVIEEPQAKIKEAPKQKTAKSASPKKKTSKRARHSKKSSAPVVFIVIILLVLVGTSAAVATRVVELPFDLPFELPDFSSLIQGSESAGDGKEQNQPQSEEQAANPQSNVSPQGAYTNNRFGFTVNIPEGFVVDSEIDNGDGIILINDALHMVVNVSGSNNVNHLDAQTMLDSLWNRDDDSIGRAEGNRVIIYQFDDKYEYFYWIFVGNESINQMKIEYPVKDDNRIELEAAQALMQGFTPGNLNKSY